MTNQHLSVFPLSICSTHEMFAADSSLYAWIHQTEKCGFVSVEVTNPNPANPQPSVSLGEVKTKTFSGQALSCINQGHCSSQMGLAARSPSLHSYLRRLMSSWCKPQAPDPEKKPGSSRWLHQEDRLAKCYYQYQMSILPLTPAPFVIIPIHALSLFLLSCTFITLMTSLICFSCHWFLCHSDSL